MTDLRSNLLDVLEEGLEWASSAGHLSRHDWRSLQDRLNRALEKIYQYDAGCKPSSHKQPDGIDVQIVDHDNEMAREELERGR